MLKTEILLDKILCIWMVGVPEREVREGGAEKIFEEIMAKYSPNLKEGG